MHECDRRSALSGAANETIARVHGERGSRYEQELCGFHAAKGLVDALRRHVLPEEHDIRPDHTRAFQALGNPEQTRRLGGQLRVAVRGYLGGEVREPGVHVQEPRLK